MKTYLTLSAIALAAAATLSSGTVLAQAAAPAAAPAAADRPAGAPGQRSFEQPGQRGSGI